MTGKVLKLVHNKQPQEVKPSDPVVIERLEQALEIAKQGGVVNMAALLVLDDGQVLDCWGSHYQAFTMVGAMESLKRDFMDRCIEGR